MSGLLRHLFALRCRPSGREPRLNCVVESFHFASSVGSAVCFACLLVVSEYVTAVHISVVRFEGGDRVTCFDEKGHSQLSRTCPDKAPTWRGDLRSCLDAREVRACSALRTVQQINSDELPVVHLGDVTDYEVQWVASPRLSLACHLKPFAVDVLTAGLWAPIGDQDSWVTVEARHAQESSRLRNKTVIQFSDSLPLIYVGQLLRIHLSCLTDGLPSILNSCVMFKVDGAYGYEGPCPLSSQRNGSSSLSPTSFVTIPTRKVSLFTSDGDAHTSTASQTKQISTTGDSEVSVAQLPSAPSPAPSSPVDSSSSYHMLAIVVPAATLLIFSVIFLFVYYRKRRLRQRTFKEGGSVLQSGILSFRRFTHSNNLPPHANQRGLNRPLLTLAENPDYQRAVLKTENADTADRNRKVKREAANILYVPSLPSTTMSSLSSASNSTGCSPPVRNVQSQIPLSRLIKGSLLSDSAASLSSTPESPAPSTASGFTAEYAEPNVVVKQPAWQGPRPILPSCYSYVDIELDRRGQQDNTTTESA